MNYTSSSSLVRARSTNKNITLKDGDIIGQRTHARLTRAGYTFIDTVFVAELESGAEEVEDIILTPKGDRLVTTREWRVII